jgi:hypothetical protein
MSWGPSLITLARTLAADSTDPASIAVISRKSCQLACSQPCPSPINYMVNGADPRSFPGGLGGILTRNIVGTKCASPRCSGGPPVVRFNGCDFGSLGSLATAKYGLHGTGTITPQQLRGFLPNPPSELQELPGLAILFSPWTDFCLLCWAMFPESQSHPTLIFAKDYYPLACCDVCAGVDWGVQNLWPYSSSLRPSPTFASLRAVASSTDKSTKNLFGAIDARAASRGLSLEEYIGRNRIVIFNVSPWFRCGTVSSDGDGIHSNLGSVHQVTLLLSSLAGPILSPSKIAALGGWAGTVSSRSVNRWLPDPPSTDLFFHPADYLGVWSKAPVGGHGKADFVNWLP